ncbi:Adenylate cyclase [Mycobacterium sp. 012931]|nr:Adenylate cyclase [Mycobacterium sp. 012931]
MLASGAAPDGASHDERALWSVGKTVTLRGHDQPTRLAAPI